MLNTLKNFFPYEYADSVFSIDYKKLFAKGFKAVIFDIDMTLVPHGFDSTPQVDNLFKEIHRAGLKTFLLTNNDEDRVKNFIKNIDTLYICNAGKPDTKNYLKAVEILQLSKSEVVYVGDQIFIDIYGANKSGIANILVKYVTATVEKNIGIRRNLEKIVLKLYSFSKSCQNRLGDIYKLEEF
ncbi:MAG: HAD-IIIA family hydrolase [Selenomonadaceae bacterium]|nr:HAD-IIIA family hydrolase [Selenomonadaceae bacterium]